MSTNTLAALREVVYEFTENTDDGVRVRQEPIFNGLIVRKELTEERKQVLRDFMRLLFHTGYIGERTKLYLLDRNITYKKLAEQLSIKSGIEVNAHTLQSSIWADKNKIDRHLTGSFLLEVIEYTTDISKYQQKIAQLIGKYGKSRVLQSKLVVQLPLAEIKRHTFTDSEFQENMQVLLPYLYTQIDYVKDTLSSDFIGYLKYLIETDKLTEQDLDRKTKLSNLIGGFDVASKDN